MKQTLFAWLASLLPPLFKDPYADRRAGKATATGKGSIARGGASGDGQSGQVVITDSQGNVVFDSWNTEANPAPVKPEKPKTKAELDYEFLKVKFSNSNSVAAISRDRYDALLRLSFENEEVDAWLDQLHTRIGQPFIFVDACHNIGLVHS